MALKILRQGDAILVPDGIVEDGIVLYADLVASYKTVTVTYSASFVGTKTITQEEHELNRVYDCSISGTLKLGPCAPCTYADSKYETCQIQVDRIEYDSETNDTYVVTEPQDVIQYAAVYSGPSSSYPPNGLVNYISVNFGGYNASSYSYYLTEYVCPDDFPKTFNDTVLYTSHPDGYEGTLTLTVDYTISIDR
jgi:hypothetical protein